MIGAPERARARALPEHMQGKKGITQLIPTYPRLSPQGQVGTIQDKLGYPPLYLLIPTYPGVGYPIITWDKFQILGYPGTSWDNFT